MFKKLLCLAAAVIMVFSLAACGGDGDKDDEHKATENQILFEEGVFEGEFVGFDGSERFSAIIRDHEQLITLFEEYDMIWYTPVWERYDSEFFNSKALILVFSLVSGSNIERFVDEICIDGTTLTLQTIWKYSGDVINDDELLLPFVIIVNKNDIANATKIEVNIEYQIVPC